MPRSNNIKNRNYLIKTLNQRVYEDIVFSSKAVEGWLGPRKAAPQGAANVPEREIQCPRKHAGTKRINSSLAMQVLHEIWDISNN